MDHTERQAEARARFAATDTATLERMWIREERVDWAEAALRAELIDRGADPDTLALRRNEAPPVHPAWLKMEAVSATVPPLRRRKAAMPLRWFIAVFAVLTIATLALAWFANYSSDATAQTRHVVLPVLAAITGGSVLLGWLRTDFRYVFSGLWSTGLCVATIVFLCLPHAAPTASLFAEVNATMDPRGTDGVEQRAVAMASRVVKDRRSAYARLEAHMAAAARATAVDDRQLANPEVRQRVHDALRAWRGDLVDLEISDERALRGLADAEAPVTAEGGRPADSISRSIEEVTASRKLLAPVRTAASTVIDARQAVVDFFDTHTLNADQASEYQKLYERRRLAEENARAIAASIDARRAGTAGAAP